MRSNTEKSNQSKCSLKPTLEKLYEDLERLSTSSSLTTEINFSRGKAGYLIPPKIYTKKSKSLVIDDDEPKSQIKSHKEDSLVFFEREEATPVNFAALTDEERETLKTRITQPIIHFQIFSAKFISIQFIQYNKTKKENEVLTKIDPLIEDILKESGGKIDKDNNQWVIPYDYSNYENIIDSFGICKINEKYFIAGIPTMSFNAINSQNYKKISFYDSRDLESEELTNYVLDYSCDKAKSIADLPESFRNKLYPFQIKGIECGIQHHCRLLIADEMGVGKTIQALALAKIYRENWPVLIICPGSVKLNWAKEILNWIPGASRGRIQVINCSRKLRINKKKTDFVITSFDLVHNIYKVLEGVSFNFIIVDECHGIKNTKSERSKRIIPMAQKAKRLLLLSGTPLLSRPVESFSVLTCLRPDLFYSQSMFEQRFCKNVSERKTTRLGAENMKELNIILNTLMIRRLKKDVLSELPPKVREKIEIECNQDCLDEIEIYRSTPKEIRKECTTKDVYLLTGLAKIKGILSYITDLIENDVKFLIFGYHREVLNAIEKKAQFLGCSYMRIDGQTSTEKKQENVTKFQTDPKCKIAILSITAAATGITLTAASMVVFAELSWTPSIMIQAEDRVHRIGQEASSVNVIYLYGKGTLDDTMFKKLDQKMNVISTTLDDKKNETELGFGTAGVRSVGDDKTIKEEENEEENYITPSKKPLDVSFHQSLMKVKRKFPDEGLININQNRGYGCCIERGINFNDYKFANLSDILDAKMRLKPNLTFSA